MTDKRGAQCSDKGRNKSVDIKGGETGALNMHIFPCCRLSLSSDYVELPQTERHGKTSGKTGSIQGKKEGNVGGCYSMPGFRKA